MTQLRIGVIAGDGVGPEVIKHARMALDRALEVAGSETRAVYTEYDLGADRWKRDGQTLPESDLDSMARLDAILLGAVGRPDVPPGVLERGLLLKLRFAFRQCVNLRPIKLEPGVACPLAGVGPERVDLVVVRENNEDLYVGTGGFTHKDTDDEVAIQTSVNTRRGVDRVLRYAFETARKRATVRVFAGLDAAARQAGKRGRLTLVAKTNVLTYAHDLYMRAFEAMAPAYPEIQTSYQHVDACAMRMIQTPESFDVIVTTNMFGDILTDLGAVLQGGLGMAASGNLNPDRAFPSMFEPVHGSAPDLAGQGKANPIAAILSAAMLLEHLGQEVAAGSIRRAVTQVLQQPEAPRTPDLGGTATTDQVGAAILAAIG
ncbi:3-isopropylmalate dehydrogenase [Isosphaera pallida ATCC 43644]|uniref:3-isopropylmalate dehydrogenase n=1 Tax=Isosphaera pallida (strain ATCC 43644 / DSM 9630 / IS1B) TaxID=575540 RepID=E8R3H6_ISOPI|nr:3-isopropylmalate dehydrogenase [Isosphaera pallida]ADV61543.1 3-isopropylmalate dehydrogenase [Isosphaera pallida ATCC 43644]